VKVNPTLSNLHDPGADQRQHSDAVVREVGDMVRCEELTDGIDVSADHEC